MGDREIDTYTKGEKDRQTQREGGREENRESDKDTQTDRLKPRILYTGHMGQSALETFVTFQTYL